MNMPTEKKRVLVASASALAVALIVFFGIVAPAEYGWDPLGSGSALGLLSMAEENNTYRVPKETAWSQDHRVFELAPFESVEFKYRLNLGDALFYRWHATGELVVDLHAEPDGSAAGYAQSFHKSRTTNDAGTYTSPFAGIHGWFWQNRSQETVTLTLVSSGYFPFAKEFRDGREFLYKFSTTSDQP